MAQDMNFFVSEIFELHVWFTKTTLVKKLNVVQEDLFPFWSRSVKFFFKYL